MIAVTSNAQAVLDLCDRIAAHTDVPGSITRTFLSPATHAVQALLREEMLTLGMTVRIDSAGNLRGIYPAASPSAPILLLGSHIDTVPNAGRYDGILGVALPLVLVRMLESQRLPFAIELIAFAEEEGIRFKMPFIGSRALIGDLTAEDLARTDSNDITLAQAIRNFGLDPAHLADAALTPDTFAFLEVHIEQGPVLESLKLSLAVVSAIAGQSRYQITFTGHANHAGTTPMHLRHDALTAAGEFLLRVEDFARSQPPLAATVGILEVTPGVANVIPGFATLSLDVRHPEDPARLVAIQSLLVKAEAIASARSLRVTAEKRSEQSSVAMHSALSDALANAVEATTHTLRRMPSGAGHDAMILARRIPAAMLFVRSPRGISHHPSESVLPQDIDAALQTCLHLLLHLDSTLGAPTHE